MKINIFEDENLKSEKFSDEIAFLPINMYTKLSLFQENVNIFVNVELAMLKNPTKYQTKLPEK